MTFKLYRAYKYNKYYFGCLGDKHYFKGLEICYKNWRECYNILSVTAWEVRTIERHLPFDITVARKIHPIVKKYIDSNRWLLDLNLEDYQRVDI